MSSPDFDRYFEALTDHPPLPWQRRLHDLMAGHDPSDWPDACDIPTGLGKTSAVACWLIALATANRNRVPRRLVYIVNRRTIVDQVTDVAETFWRRLRDDSRLTSLRQTLATDLANREGDAAGDALAISTLRGEFADNGAWRADPARASIIIGTPDLIGSDLLFSGYRTGKRSLAHQAGLLGHDALLVHDEAHLSPAMQVLLGQIAEMQRKHDSPRPIRVLALSATQRSSDGKPPLTLDHADNDNDTVRQRLQAFKRLAVESMEKMKEETAARFRKRWCEAMAEHAWGRYQDRTVRVVVYVRSPDDAKAIHDDLRKRLRAANRKTAPNRLALLTGRLRGHERDELAAGPILTALRDAKPVAETIYLVATSAGEVGVDLDADHLICDLTTADALIQRIGRLNRRGLRTADQGCHIDLIAGPDEAPKRDAADARARWSARQKTLDLLCSLATGDDGRIDASPQAIREQWNVPEDCLEPQPEVLPLTEPMVSALSMTSVDRTQRVDGKLVSTWPLLPDIGTLIHGLVEDTVEVTLAWRAEVAYIADPQRSAEDVEQLVKQTLKACPVRAAERLTLPTNVALDWLKKRAKKLDGATHFGLLVGGGVERLRLDGESEAHRLVGRTLLLPPAFGGLDRSGTPDATATTAPERLDLGDRDSVRRFLVREASDGYELRRLAVGADDDDAWREVDDVEGKTSRNAALDATTCDGFARRVTIPLVGVDDAGARLDLVIARQPNQEGSSDASRVELESHNTDVGERLSRFAKALDLERGWGKALEDAGLGHDTGKSRHLWQTFANNLDFGDPVAKPIGRGQPDWRILDGYRHEYGSLLDAVDDGIDDPLTLHGIASHHAGARPHFNQQFDPGRIGNPPPEASALAIALRFDALQKQHGPWGLAWLEALLRSADRTVSAGDAADDFNVEEDADA